MEIAGITVRDSDMLDLADILRNAGSYATAEHIETTVLAYKPHINLTPDERDQLLSALLVLPDGELAELRTTLRMDRAWRHARGL